MEPMDTTQHCMKGGGFIQAMAQPLPTSIVDEGDDRVTRTWADGTWTTTNELTNALVACSCNAPCGTVAQHMQQEQHQDSESDTDSEPDEPTTG